MPGNSKLGDHFDNYRVAKGGRHYACSCQTHNGGEYRKFCTHAYAVALAEYDGVVVDAVREVEPEPEPEPVEEEPLHEALGVLEPEKQPEVVLPTPSRAASPPPDISEEAIRAVPLPDGATEPYPSQIEALKQILEGFQHHDLVVLDGPTGTGKTWIGWAVAHLLDPGGTTAYLAQDKALQDQFLQDYGVYGARTIKGRANYTPQISTVTAWDGSLTTVTCEDCDLRSKKCSFCPDPAACSYTVAKQEAATAPVAVLNYAYFVREAASPYPKFSGRKLVIADECDVIEGQILNYVTVTYSERLRDRLHLGQPRKLDDDTGEAYVEWLDEIVLPALKREHERLKADKRLDRVKRSRQLKASAARIDKTKQLIDEIPEGAWVLDGYYKDRRRGPKRGPLVFKPVMVNDHGRRALFRHGEKWLLMSATPIDPELLVRDIGWDKSFETVVAPMPFDKERRKVYAAPIATLRWKDRETEVPKMLKGIEAVLDAWDERAIIHTVSYQMTREVHDYLERRGHKVFTYQESAQKEAIIKAFGQTPGAVLVGPSIGRGTDFKGDLARVNIIAKVPFPSLGDKRINRRLYMPGGDRWYATQTIRELVQMTGRTTRGRDDWSVTYILDGQFFRLFSDHSRLFPNWLREALDMSVTKDTIMSGRIPTYSFE